MESLLDNLGIEKPNWNGDNEFASYAALDDKIVDSLCAKLKSESIIDGYTKLMTLGGLPFDYSETDNELLAAILTEQEKIQSNLTDKISTYEPVESVEPTPEIEQYDYSNVKIEFSRADFELGIPMTGSKWTLSNRKILSLPKDLQTQIKNLICEHLCKAEVEAIEISVKTKHDVQAEYYARKHLAQSSIKPKSDPPPFTSDELSDALTTLNLVEDIIKAID
ncbi:MAG: hypothetical protein IJU91_06480 [Selenomonadaceae bacterium]|nr:hypothetical protein [Selenomonadaceae bacterium]